MAEKETKTQILTLANDCFDQEAYEDAVLWYTSYLTRDPDDTGVMLDLGYCLFRLGRYEEALSWFVKIGHNRNIALTLVQMERYEDAIPYFQAVLDENPGLYAIRFNYMSLLWYLRRFDEAESVQKAAPRLPPMTYMGLGTIFRAHASEDFQKRNKSENLTPPKMVDIISHRQGRIMTGPALSG